VIFSFGGIYYGKGDFLTIDILIKKFNGWDGVPATYR